MADNVEDLTLTGTGNISATGNALANVLTGNSGANTLVGAGGDDSLSGGAGIDRLVGRSGDDRLIGGTGADTMLGGTGSDQFVVDSASDVLVEAVGEGTDAVTSAVSFVLPDNVERITLTGTGNISATGNALANVLTGNSGANTLVGAGGDDSLSGGAGIDRLVGRSGDDRLIGGTGADTMLGGTGSDQFVVDSASDVLVEAVGEGTDAVTSAVSFVLPGNVERITLGGTGNISATGNALANKLTGNSGANVLEGGAGVDTIFGNGGLDTIVGDTGSDTLQGDGGADTFLYRSLSHGAAVGTDTTRGATVGDTIADFAVGTDGFDFLASAFDPAGAIGLGTLTLDDDFSVIVDQYDGANAGTNANHTAGEATFVFSTADDTLYYDPDGTTTAGYVVVATLGNGATLTAADIELVAG